MSKGFWVIRGWRCSGLISMGTMDDGAPEVPPETKFRQVRHKLESTLAFVFCW